MYNSRRGYRSWDEVFQDVLLLPKHIDVTVEKWQVPNIPIEFAERLADNDGQLANYGAALEDDRGIHIKVYDEYYKVHWDEKDPNVDPIGHLIKDSPRWLAIGGIAAAVVIGGVLLKYRKKKN